MCIARCVYSTFSKKKNSITLRNEDGNRRAYESDILKNIAWNRRSLIPNRGTLLLLLLSFKFSCASLRFVLFLLLLEVNVVLALPSLLEVPGFILFIPSRLYPWSVVLELLAWLWSVLTSRLESFTSLVEVCGPVCNGEFIRELCAWVKSTSSFENDMILWFIRGNSQYCKWNRTGNYYIPNTSFQEGYLLFD